MRFIALLVWFVTALWGLYMLAVWLIENDATRQDKAESRLPLPVILSHVTLAVSGLVVWVLYLLIDRSGLAWAAVGILVAIALLGFTMFARWIPVYRDPVTAARPSRIQAETHTVSIWTDTRTAPVQAETRTVPAQAETHAVPAEGNFPIAVVVTHGLLAGSTLVLVLLTALGVGAS